MISYEQLLGHLADCHCVPNPDVHVEGGEMYYNLNEGMDCCCIIYPPVKENVYSVPTLMRIFDDLR